MEQRAWPLAMVRVGGSGTSARSRVRRKRLSTLAETRSLAREIDAGSRAAGVMTCEIDAGSHAQSPRAVEGVSVKDAAGVQRP